MFWQKRVIEREVVGMDRVLEQWNMLMSNRVLDQETNQLLLGKPRQWSVGKKETRC